MTSRSWTHRLRARLSAAWWTLRGRRALSRGDAIGAVRALRRALEWEPEAYAAWLHLGRAFLREHCEIRARAALQRALRADPVRFAREAPAQLSADGFDRRILLEPAPVADVPSDGPKAPAPVGACPAPQRAAEGRAVEATHLPFGDCRTLDEYTHFQAMPPIAPDEWQDVDWDGLEEDLLDG